MRNANIYLSILSVVQIIVLVPHFISQIL